MEQITLIIALVMPFLLLLAATTALLLNTVKQKKILRLQQQKLQEFTQALSNTSNSIEPTKTYKQYLYEQLELTQERFLLVAPGKDITKIDADKQSINQQIVALRYAVLRAEELSTSAIQGSEGYWSALQQALGPLIHQTSGNQNDNNDELDAYKKRVENLEKFKKLFLELEKNWNQAQENAQSYYNQLHALAADLEDTEQYTKLLEQYSNSYNLIDQEFQKTSTLIDGRTTEQKVINIVRQDPRATEEIIKLRNVAADQHRVIGDLQRQLKAASSTEAKEILIGELEQQLERQMRFVQESDTCIQLLEQELHQAHEQLVEQEQLKEKDKLLTEENQRIKSTLTDFTHESKDLLANIEALEEENHQLKNIGQTTQAEPDTQALKSELVALRKDYAELEESYLALKMK